MNRKNGITCRDGEKKERKRERKEERKKERKKGIREGRKGVLICAPFSQSEWAGHEGE